MRDLDGGILKNGKIRDRIIRQAALKDMLTITQREFEYGIKNAVNPHEKLIFELERLNTLLAKKDLSPTTYGVYRVTNKVFMREALSATKLDVAYIKFLEKPVLKFKEIIDAFIKKKTNQTEEEKIGIFKRMYAKITSITPKQLTIWGGSAVVVGIGVDRYFAVDDTPTINEEVSGGEVNTSEAKEVSLEDKQHKEQLNRTQKEDTKRVDEHTEALEIELDELID